MVSSPRALEHNAMPDPQWSSLIGGIMLMAALWLPSPPSAGFAPWKTWVPAQSLT